MTDLERILRKKGIIYEADYRDVMKGPENDVDTKLVDVDNGIIIVAQYSEVLPTILLLYDLETFELIGQQDMEKELSFRGGMSWNSWAPVDYVLKVNGEWVNIGDDIWDMWNDSFNYHGLDYYEWILAKRREGILKYRWEVA